MGTFNVKSGNGSAKRGAASRIGTSIFFFLFLAFGLVFMFFLMREFLRTEQAYSWTEVPCEIFDSRYAISDREDRGYEFLVGYRYSFNGQDFTSNVYGYTALASNDFEDIQRAMIRFATGAQAVCWIDPDSPSNSVLHRAGRATYLTSLFPLIFVLIGAGGLWFTWRREKPDVGGPKAVSVNPPHVLGRRIVIGIGALFLLIGCIFTVAFTVPGIVRAIKSRTWPAAQATVISSRVQTHRGDDTTYSVDVLYRYEFEGKAYLSNTYGLVGGSSSGHESKRKIVSQLGRGTSTTAYVNPNDPVIAVLDRTVGPVFLLLFIPVVFALIGGLMFVGGVMRAGKPAVAPMAELGDAKPLVETKFSSATDRRGKFIGLTIFALFWNGFVWGIIWLIRVNNEGNWFVFLFLGIFALIGFGVGIAAIHSLLAIFNPLVTLTLSHVPIRLGDKVTLKWALDGKIDRVQRLTIVLEGCEQARYRRGTDTVTDKNTFFTLMLADTSRRIDIGRGSVQFQVPDDTMHTFEAKDNKILWFLVTKGEIPNWPDVKDEMQLVIEPWAM